MVAAGTSTKETVMSKNASNAKTNDSNNNASKAPTHIAYHIRDNEGGKGYWTRIGAAWPLRPHHPSRRRGQERLIAARDGRAARPARFLPSTKAKGTCS
jgi:hypothetical protein